MSKRDKPSLGQPPHNPRNASQPLQNQSLAQSLRQNLVGIPPATTKLTDRLAKIAAQKRRQMADTINLKPIRAEDCPAAPEVVLSSSPPVKRRRIYTSWYRVSILFIGLAGLSGLLVIVGVVAYTWVAVQ